MVEFNKKVLNKLEELNKSKFRASFHLKTADYQYLKDKGYKVIESHAREFILKRLAPTNPKNDGEQTPMKGHPVFIAQHATACCCRSCLKKWHHIAKNKPLSKEEQNYLVQVIMAWITKEYKKEFTSSLKQD